MSLLPIRGKRAGLFRLVAIPLAALLASHLVLYRRLPGEANYQFPWSGFLTISLIMTACWEANLWVFRRLDQRMPFHQNPLRRVGQQILLGALVTTLTFMVVLTLISVIGYQNMPSAKQYATGLLICFTIATIINGIYVGLYLIRVIYWQKQETAEQLNQQLTRQQQSTDRQEATEPVSVAENRQIETVAVAPARTGILIDMGNQLQQFQPDEIAYIFSSGGIVQLTRMDGRTLTTNYDSLAALDGRLPGDLFFQINRQFIVHLNAIRTVRDDVNRKLIIQLLLTGAHPSTAKEITISRYRSAEFRQWLSSVTRP